MTLNKLRIATTQSEYIETIYTFGLFGLLLTATAFSSFAAEERTCLGDGVNSPSSDLIRFLKYKKEDCTISMGKFTINNYS